MRFIALRSLSSWALLIEWRFSRLTKQLQQ